MNKIENLLPIGSVVVLGKAEKKVMITGILQTNISETGEKEDYDYVGVLYPEGSLGRDMNFLFNSEDISTVYFKGYEDNERKEFIETLSENFGK